MKMTHLLAGLSLSVLFSACATIQGESDVDQGRQALLEGDYQGAPRLISGCRESRPHLRLWYRASYGRES